MRDICTALNIKSPSTAHRYVTMLKEKGLVSVANNKRKSLILNTERKADIPILGNIAAGQPITAVEDILGYVSYSGFTGDSKDMFALLVKGDSMIDAGIFEGDCLIIRKTPVARNGQIVAAMVDNEATVKRFYKEDGHFRLQPENQSMEPMIFENVDILGVVVASIRRYE